VRWSVWHARGGRAFIPHLLLAGYSPSLSLFAFVAAVSTAGPVDGALRVHSGSPQRRPLADDTKVTHLMRSIPSPPSSKLMYLLCFPCGEKRGADAHSTADAHVSALSPPRTVMVDTGSTILACRCPPTRARVSGRKHFRCFARRCTRQGLLALPSTVVAPGRLVRKCSHGSLGMPLPVLWAPSRMLREMVNGQSISIPLTQDMDIYPLPASNPKALPHSSAASVQSWRASFGPCCAQAVIRESSVLGVVRVGMRLRPARFLDLERRSAKLDQRQSAVASVEHGGCRKKKVSVEIAGVDRKCCCELGMQGIFVSRKHRPEKRQERTRLAKVGALRGCT